ncbi:Ig-like domain-containing protein [Nocardioides insulae]|uniref:Ig-like domain-containing protein n=1 Tax=Nocardioides insulae TaxID=394734 RepID=UPI000688BA82|nr:Ig-like domain-containing protein [Nocardioides insulae]
MARSSRGRAVSLAPYLALLIVVAGLSWVAVRADGYQAHDPELHDGGVWVTNTADGFYGRMNKPINQLDSAIPAELGSTPDVVQDGAAVVAVDPGQGSITAIDPGQVEMVQGERAVLPADAAVQLAGGTVAVLDPASGQLWAQRVDPVAQHPTVSALDSQTDPTAELGGDAALAVSRDGDVVVLSAAEDQLTELSAGESGLQPADPQDLESPVGAGSTVTTVGDTAVVLDRESGTLSVVGGGTSQLAPDAVLQQPGPDAGSVLVAEGDRLVSVDLASGEAEVIADGAAGTPAQPVRLGACVFGAWSGADGYVAQRCGDEDTAMNTLGAGSSDLVFRVNRGEIVLNDRSSGRVWDLDTDAPTRIDDWESFKKKTVDTEDDKQQEDETTSGDRRPPKAEDDQFGARPGRTTVLYPLDNDAAPQGRLLSVQSLDQPSDPDTELTISPNGQTVQIRLPQGATRPVTFAYHVDDGREGVSDQAQVTVTPRQDGENEVPALREGFEPETWSVPAGGVLEIPVLPDWRDYDDGDPISVAAATAERGDRTGATARVTGSGRIRFTAPAQRGDSTISYQVSDGVGEPVEESVRVRVQDHRDRQAVAPSAQPDVVSGEVGKPILIRPLANDHPGSDPTTPDAELVLAGQVASPGGARVSTDLVEGTVTLRANSPRTYFLDYDAAYGNSQFSRAKIRVDVRPAQNPPRDPVAMPDQVTLSGQAPTLVDVLANDVDAAGRVLTVQGAQAADDADLDVSVVEGRWVRIAARQPLLGAGSRVVHYTLSNGANSGVTGDVMVSQRPRPEDNTPVTEVDRVTVRAGSAAAIPVLDNDFSPAGDPLRLVDDVAEAEAGQLVVRPPGDEEVPLGQAYVTGRVVKYVAPTVRETTTYTIGYQATNSAGEVAPGSAEVTVLPAEDNRPPEPPLLEGRVMAGGEVTLRLPGAEVDPDGDPVTLTSISVPPKLGRILSSGANSLVYEAFPGSTGTDEFSYRVEDPQGAEAEGTVRVGVTEPAEVQAPLAVDDTARAAPGRRIVVDALANDHVAEGDRVSMELVDPPEGVSLDGTTGPVSVRVPNGGEDVKVVYTLSNGVSTTRATILVRAVEGFNNPPVVPDAFGQDAEGGAAENTVVVDVLEDAVDPDGPKDALQVTEVTAPAALAASVDGGSVTLTRGEHPTVVPVRVEDADGGATTASVYVPAAGSSLPYVDGAIELDPGETVTAALEDYVVDPSGEGVSLTLKDRIWPSPEGQINATVTGEREFEVSAGEQYAGPGAVSVEVLSGVTDTSPGVKTVLSVPVQVGSTRPALRCPSSPLEVAQGQTIEMDITALCHTWTSDPDEADDLEYTADWEAGADGLSIIEPRGEQISVEAAPDAEAGTEATLAVKTRGSEPGLIPVVVVAAPSPSLAPVSVEDMAAGEERRVDLLPYLTTGADNPDPQILSIEAMTELDVDAEVDGTSLVLRAGEDVHGTARFAVTMADVGGNPPANRQASSTLEVTILDTPDAPTAPVPGRTVRSQEVVLSWRAPEANGAPIDRYRVTGDHGAGTRECGSTGCTITGLTNGVDYTFTVEAHNRVGWSDPSPRSAVATPDAKPGIVGEIRRTRVGDGTIALAWTAPTTQTSAIERYHVSWPGGEGATVSGPAATIGGLDNDKTYVFTVVAENAFDVGPGRTSAPYQSIGTPPAPGAPTVTDQETAGDAGAVSLAWGPVLPNGPGPVTYTVQRNGAPLAQCTNQTATTCDDTGISYDGQTYRYTVTASNAGVPGTPGGAARTSAPSAAESWTAVGKPADWGSWSASAPKADGKAVVSYTVPNSRGATSTVKVTVGGTVYTYEETGQQSHSYDLSTGSAHSVSLQLCNEQTCGAETGSTSVQTYDQLTNAIRSVTANRSGNSASWTVTVDTMGRSASLRIRSSQRDVSKTLSGTGVQTYTTSAVDLGYEVTEKVTVTVTDSGRGSDSATASVTTPDRPARSVRVSHGSKCNDSGSTPCKVNSPDGTRCDVAECRRIGVTLENFNLEDPGATFRCTANSSAGGGFQIRQLSDGYAEPGWYAGRIDWIEVTCDGVSSGKFDWY